MADSIEDSAWVKLGVAAALHRRLLSDVRDLLPFLAKMFDEALPGEAQIETRGWFSSKRVVGVAVKLGDTRIAIRDPGAGPLVATKTKVVRGIELKTSEAPLEECVAEIGAAVEARLAKTAGDHATLKRALGLD